MAPRALAVVFFKNQHLFVVGPGPNFVNPAASTRDADGSNNAIIPKQRLALVDAEELARSREVRWGSDVDGLNILRRRHTGYAVASPEDLEPVHPERHLAVVH